MSVGMVELMAESRRATVCMQLLSAAMSLGVFMQKKIKRKKALLKLIKQTSGENGVVTSW